MGLSPIGTSASIAAQAPSLHRSYPASSVLRASPPSQSARPFSHELPVDPYCDHRWDFPCCVWSTVPACRRQYPGRFDGICSLVRFHQLRPSLEPGRVGSCITLFEACSAFTHVTACTLAKSPSDSLHQRLQQSRCLHRCSDCYRVERTSSRAGYSRCGPPPFHGAPGYANLPGKWNYYRVARRTGIILLQGSSNPCRWHLG